MDNRINNSNYILISGTGRSGTNITKTLLSGHSKIFALPFEHRFTIDPDGIVSTFNILKNTWSPFQATVAINRLEDLLMQMCRKRAVRSLFGELLSKIDQSGRRITPGRYYNWNLSEWFPNFENHVVNLISELKKISYNGYWPGEKGLIIKNRINFITYQDRIKILISAFNKFINNTVYDLLMENNKTMFIEDNTWSLLFAKELSEILSGCRYLHIIRDPRDVIVSMRQQRWCPSNIDKVIVFYSSIMDNIQSNIKFLGSEIIYTIRLEDIVLKCDVTLHKIYDFIGIEYESTDKKTLLSDASFQRWKRELTKLEIATLNKKLAKYIVLLGYEL